MPRAGVPERPMILMALGAALIAGTLLSGAASAVFVAGRGSHD